MGTDPDGKTAPQCLSLLSSLLPTRQHRQWRKEEHNDVTIMTVRRLQSQVDFDLLLMFTY
jgi:hypothetical protein